MPESRGYGVQRVGKIAPARRRVGTVRGELATRALPPGKWRLRFVDLVRGHAVEVIVLRIMLAHVIEAQETPGTRPIEVRRLQRRLEFAGRIATGDGAPCLCSFHPPVHPGLLRRHQIPLYRGNERTENRPGRD